MNVVLVAPEWLRAGVALITYPTTPQLFVLDANPSPLPLFWCVWSAKGEWSQLSLVLSSASANGVAASASANSR